MRTALFHTVSVVSASIAIVALVIAPPTASADEDIAGVYEVKFDEVANSCTQVGMTMGRGTVTLKRKRGKLVVDIERIPNMVGSLPRDGKLKAESKLGPSTIEGLDGKFSVVGRAGDGMLQLVFVADFFVKRKPYCTQSWNVAGLKQSELDKKRS